MKFKKASSIFLCLLLLGIYYYPEYKTYFEKNPPKSYAISEIPSYEGDDYIIIDENEPSFDKKDFDKPFEKYGKLDSLGRCTVAYANINESLMPTKERESIGMVKPTGFINIKYDTIEGKYLYNRCHLIGYQLTGENANERNLITCTRYMNVGVMLTFENMVTEYIKQTKNSVLYRVTPIFDDDNLVASGIEMEALSKDEKIKFHVYIYNIQPGIYIDYKTGKSKKE